jgi:hypothetical protein
MLIPIRHRTEAGADQGKNDEEWENYNSMGVAACTDRTHGGRLWRQLDLADARSGLGSNTTLESITSASPTSASPARSHYYDPSVGNSG